MAADTELVKYADNIFNAVSARFITQEDLASQEITAKIRVKLGYAAYIRQENIKLSALNFVYEMANTMIAGIGNYTPESRSERANKAFYQYQRLFCQIAGQPVPKEATHSTAVDNLMKLYNKIFT